MSDIERFPGSARTPTEYETLLAGPYALNAIPGAVYVCDHEGWLIRHNAEAAALWGRTPAPGRRQERFGGAHRLFRLDGTPLPHGECPMATAVLTGAPTRNAEIMMERPDGSRFVALVNIRALTDPHGRVEGAINCFQDISERKKTEERVRDQHKDLEDFFENGAVGLHIVSGEGIILRANKAELNLLGYAAEEYVGRHIADFHADAQVIGDILQRLSCGEKLDHQPARLRARDGSIKHVLITSNTRFENGRFVNTRCFTTDVTSLRTAEKARRDSDERLGATYEAATVGIIEVDERGRMLRVNDAICKMLGHAREALLHTTFHEHTDGEDQEADAASYARQVAGELDNYAIRKRVRKRNGSLAYLDVFSSSVRGDDGAFRYGVRVIQDVTEAKRMEDRLRDNEAHMRALLEALPAAVYTTDAKGRITFYNKAAVEMAGRTPLPGDEWCVAWRLHTTDGRPLPHRECPMAVALREDRPVRGEEAIVERPDGTFVPFIPYPTPLHDAAGKLVGAINMMVDITERKSAENRQRLLIDELNHRVKNTLATVQSLAGQTARHATSPEDFVRRFELRLLALARAHDLLTKRQWVDASLASLAHDILQPLAGEMSARVRIEGPPVELTPRAALSLTMALSELLTNALKYGSLSSPAGTLVLAWDLRHESDGTHVDLRWQERGGPAVAPPVRRGFGSRLMARCIEYDLSGEIDLAFEPDGVSCRIGFPVSSPAEA
jgi:PAS domain S-box-containing protein